ncbi:hypothetical protein A9Y76_07075 [Ralstonia insidiosa]|uniref:Uncharacterized protein n=1 Tax=Ralstonia insidiosa TaxID=190721 RepID=A0A191ZVQ9_9RALS|nr:hypothetical protein [Ralstonia insidiosa]ANJ72240.1 hypothetical protein A9Y76_07075 [Ralstonia insidiosa]
MIEKLLLTNKICSIETTKQSDLVLVDDANENFIKGTIVRNNSKDSDHEATYKNTGKVVLYGINQITRLTIEEDIKIK